MAWLTASSSATGAAVRLPARAAASSLRRSRCVAWIDSMSPCSTSWCRRTMWGSVLSTVTRAAMPRSVLPTSCETEAVNSPMTRRCSFCKSASRVRISSCSRRRRSVRGSSRLETTPAYLRASSAYLVRSAPSLDGSAPSVLVFRGAILGLQLFVLRDQHGLAGRILEDDHRAEPRPAVDDRHGDERGRPESSPRVLGAALLAALG